MKRWITDQTHSNLAACVRRQQASHDLKKPPLFFSAGGEGLAAQKHFEIKIVGVPGVAWESPLSIVVSTSNIPVMALSQLLSGTGTLTEQHGGLPTKHVWFGLPSADSP